MSKITDFQPLEAEDIKDDAVIYLVQDGKDHQTTVGELKETLEPVEVPTVELVSTNW